MVQSSGWFWGDSMSSPFAALAAMGVTPHSQPLEIACGGVKFRQIFRILRQM